MSDWLKFNKTCMRVAVCLYGQYRAGDYLLNNFRNIQASAGCEVDFHCSTKSLNNVRTSPGDARYVDPGMLEQKITAGLKPKSFNIIADSVDQRFEEVSAERSGLLYSIADSIRLKTEYESANHFVYDMVILTRYDALIAPVDFINKLRRWYNTIKMHDFERAFGYSIVNNWLISSPLYSEDWGTWGIQDILFVGSSYSTDALATELQWIIHGNLDGYANHAPIAHTMCGHSGIMQAARSAGINVSRSYPFTDRRTGEYTFDEQLALTRRGDGIKITLIRDTWDLETMIKEMPIEDPRAIYYYTKKWRLENVRVAG